MTSTSTNDVVPSSMLVPIVHPHEALRPHIPERPAISLAETPLQLGRNSLTQIADSRISRYVCRITREDNGQYKIVATKPTSIFYLNGTKHDMNTTSSQNVTLNNGDTLCLYNEHGDSDDEKSFQYAYTVHLKEGEENHNHNNNESALSSSPGRSPARKRRASEVAASPPGDDDNTTITTTAPHLHQVQLQAAAEEFTCAFCLDILVQATTLVPCGHVFCQCCVASHKQCPTCRADVKSTVACRTLDNAIAAMAYENNPFFTVDDLEVYRQRMQDATGTNGGDSTSGSSSHHHANRSAKRAKRRRQKAASASADSSHGGTTAEDAICID